jgi:hypothetical protein
MGHASEKFEIHWISWGMEYLILDVHIGNCNDMEIFEVRDSGL